MRDHTKLEVFGLADSLVMMVYQTTTGFPKEERYGLQSQIRRAAVSVAANIVEGCARKSQADYLRFLEIAYGSARELQYEIDVSYRLGFISGDSANSVIHACTRITKALNGLLRALRG